MTQQVQKQNKKQKVDPPVGLRLRPASELDDSNTCGLAQLSFPEFEVGVGLMSMGASDVDR